MNHVPTDDEVWRRLRWSARRGMRELDVLLERYLQTRWALASTERKGEFMALLELSDPELAAVCLGRVPPPTGWEALILELTGPSSELSEPNAVYPDHVGPVSRLGGDA